MMEVPLKVKMMMMFPKRPPWGLPEELEPLDKRLKHLVKDEELMGALELQHPPSLLPLRLNLLPFPLCPLLGVDWRKLSKNKTSSELLFRLFGLMAKIKRVNPSEENGK
jgi:hypothetical protein